jgi:capsule polysaccharide export protein KpsE/RkpR
MSHINHVIYWRAGGMTVETIDDEAVLIEKTRARYRARAPESTAANAAHQRAIEAHEAARRDPAVRRSVVLMVAQSGHAGVLAAYPSSWAA